jgi:hypothetical protein
MDRQEVFTKLRNANVSSDAMRTTLAKEGCQELTTFVRESGWITSRKSLWFNAVYGKAQAPGPVRARLLFSTAAKELVLQDQSVLLLGLMKLSGEVGQAYSNRESCGLDAYQHLFVVGFHTGGVECPLQASDTYSVVEYMQDRANNDLSTHILTIRSSAHKPLDVWYGEVFAKWLADSMLRIDL